VPVLASVVIVVATRAPGRLTTAGVTLIWVATAVSRVLAI